MSSMNQWGKGLGLCKEDWIPFFRQKIWPSFNVHFQTGPFKLKEKPPNTAHNTGDKLEHYRLTIALQMGRKAREWERERERPNWLSSFTSFLLQREAAAVLQPDWCEHHATISRVILLVDFSETFAYIATVGPVIYLAIYMPWNFSHSQVRRRDNLAPLEVTYASWASVGQQAHMTFEGLDSK